eukprot:11601-Pelagococcus_subviridis.AAC.2
MGSIGLFDRGSFQLTDVGPTCFVGHGTHPRPLLPRSSRLLPPFHPLQIVAHGDAATLQVPRDRHLRPQVRLRLPDLLHPLRIRVLERAAVASVRGEPPVRLVHVIARRALEVLHVHVPGVVQIPRAVRVRLRLERPPGGRLADDHLGVPDAADATLVDRPRARLGAAASLLPAAGLRGLLLLRARAFLLLLLLVDVEADLEAVLLLFRLVARVVVLVAVRGVFLLALRRRRLVLVGVGVGVRVADLPGDVVGMTPLVVHEVVVVRLLEHLDVFGMPRAVVLLQPPPLVDGLHGACVERFESPRRRDRAVKPVRLERVRRPRHERVQFLLRLLMVHPQARL